MTLEVSLMAYLMIPWKTARWYDVGGENQMFDDECRQESPYSHDVGDGDWMLDEWQGSMRYDGTS